MQCRHCGSGSGKDQQIMASVLSKIIAKCAFVALSLVTGQMFRGVEVI